MVLPDLKNLPWCVLGVDPGKSGAVCRLGGGSFDVRRDFKVRGDIARAIRDLRQGVQFGVIEFVHSMPTDGIVGCFTFGRAAGEADGAMALCLRGPTEEVSPQEWQQFYRRLLDLPKGDFESRAVVPKVLPCALPFLGRAKDHNTGDAILIAAWKLFGLAQQPGRL